MDEMNRIRKITLTGLLLLFALLPLAAQERTDTVYTFRFVTGNDMFYVPWNGNDKELARLEACVERLKERIFAGEIPVRVEGYCTSLGSEVDNLAMAKIRSNRVKSELIIRQGLTEACFVTKNHSGSGDYVTVRISVPKVATAAQKDERQQAGQESADTQQEQRETEESRFVAEQIRADSMVVVHPEAYVPAETTGTAAEETSGTDSYTLSLRANLLRWATLTPDLGLEWRISPSWGILVNDQSVMGNPRERLVDLVVVERQGPPLRPLGGHAGSALVYGQGEARLPRCDVQGRAVQLQVLRHRQAGRPDGRRHHRRLPVAPE